MQNLPIIETQLLCLSCNTYVDATACTVRDTGLIECPNCGKDICNEEDL